MTYLLQEQHVGMVDEILSSRTPVVRLGCLPVCHNVVKARGDDRADTI